MESLTAQPAERGVLAGAWALLLSCLGGSAYGLVLALYTDAMYEPAFQLAAAFVGVVVGGLVGLVYGTVAGIVVGFVVARSARRGVPARRGGTMAASGTAAVVGFALAFMLDGSATVDGFLWFAFIPALLAAALAWELLRRLDHGVR